MAADLFLLQRRQGFVGAAKQQQHVAHVVQGVDTAARVVAAEQRKALLVVFVGLFCGKMLARDVASFEVRKRGARQAARVLEVPVGDRMLTSVTSSVCNTFRLR